MCGRHRANITLPYWASLSPAGPAEEVKEADQIVKLEAATFSADGADSMQQVEAALPNGDGDWIFRGTIPQGKLAKHQP